MKSLPLRAHEAAAYAAGRLTQLRRVCKGPQQWVRIPYGAPGDTLALREGWSIVVDSDDVYEWMYRADYKPGTRLYEYPCGCGFCADDPECARWKPSTQMPLKMVRWHLVITAVRLERVQDISEADARACGIGFTEGGPLHWHTMIGDWCVNRATHKEAAQDLWEHLNPRTPWDSNPWTWVIDVEGNTK